jgi:patatin-related protein
MPDRDVRKEVRFAVVMYGGVSLAIYINGVVQELFRMVRATAADPHKGEEFLLLPDEELSGTERVYRQLGRMLGEGEQKGKPLRPKDPVRTSFVVDILSGSSAGGINAVYLAKALANGQNIDQLSKLWTDEGDIMKLINDEESVKQVDGLAFQRPPRSLLNGKRMYRKLLEALDGMKEGKRSEAETISPYVEELDLFVTATDFYGLPVPLRLASGVVKERRHRNVYQLRYSHKFADRVPNDSFSKKDPLDPNDFLAENDPFLAFAARSTSAFPFAFDPIELADTKAMLETAPGYRDLQDAERNPERWRKFFPAYQQRLDLPKRAFVDGGYLDNKPFSYATDAVASRSSSVPVDRKLFYIEPSPEHIEDLGQDGDVPNAIDNVAAALSSLPRYEPIREDLQRILAHNRLVERVDRILSGMEDDAQNGTQSEPPAPRGTAHAGYRGLKIEALTYEIAKMITRTAKFDVQSDEFLAIRYLVRAWREAHFPNNEEFLERYDLVYLLRRLSFVLKKIDQLYDMEDKTARILTSKPETDEDNKAFRDKLINLRADLSEVYATLYRTREELATPEPKNPLTGAVEDTRLDPENLIKLLEEPTEEARYEKAKYIVSESTKEAAFRALASALENFIGPRIEDAIVKCREILDSPQPDEGSQRFATIARDSARHYYDSFERYDTISYPILYATEVGEEIDQVEVFRISPQDAPSLIDERDPDERRRKLAGTALKGFGAFLDHDWRRNDILWGRLDGAERIITTLLPDASQETERTERIREAQLEILADALKNPDRFSGLLVDAMTTTGSAEPSEDTLRELAEHTRSGNFPLEGQALLDSFGANYKVDRQMNRKTALQALARSSWVVGGMLEDIAGGGAGRGPAVWLARLGAIFWRLVEVSVPGSRRNLTLRRQLRWLYIFETLLIVAGIFVNWLVALFGVVALIATAAVHAGTQALGAYIRRRRRWRWWLAPIAGIVVLTTVAIILLTVLGAYHLWVDYLSGA